MSLSRKNDTVFVCVVYIYTFLFLIYKLLLFSVLCTYHLRLEAEGCVSDEIPD